MVDDEIRPCNQKRVLGTERYLKANVTLGSNQNRDDDI